MSAQRVAVVTGANRGIGLATVRAFLKKFNGDVYLTSRNTERGLEAVKSLNAEGLKPKFHQLDTSDQKSITTFKGYLLRNYGGVNIFVHNAGIMYHERDPTPASQKVESVITTNYLDAVNVCNTFLPHMKSEGRMVILSSGLSMSAFRECSKDMQNFFKSSSLTQESLTAKMNEYVAAAQSGDFKTQGFSSHPYGMSKVGVNALTRILSWRTRDLHAKNVLVNCCCPGWVRTDLGGPHANFSPDQGAEIPVMLSLIPEGKTEPNGKFYQRRKLIEWY